MRKRYKNYDYIRDMSVQEMSQFFCDLMNDCKSDYGCDICPKRDLCRVGLSGFQNWLEDDYG